jgi:hypothetical protein
VFSFSNSDDSSTWKNVKHKVDPWQRAMVVGTTAVTMKGLSLFCLFQKLMGLMINFCFKRKKKLFFGFRCFLSNYFAWFGNGCVGFLWCWGERVGAGWQRILVWIILWVCMDSEDFFHKRLLQLKLMI